jgi:hemolysin III
MPAEPIIESFFLRQPVSAMTHLLGAAGALYVTAVLWRLARGDRMRQWIVCCFGACMTLLYAASCLYHAVPLPPAQLRYLLDLDLSAIYLLIAGTYTPIFALVLAGRVRVALLALIWSVALVGIGSVWLLPQPPYPLTVGLYIGLGCLGMIPAPLICQALTFRSALWGLIGGLVYATGGICDTLRWPVLVPGWFQSHETLHVFDLLGTLVHVYFVAGVIIPYHRRVTGR